MTRTAELMRIGDVAARVGTTPRTIRFYEEKGLLPDRGDREAGAHRAYDAADVERLEHVLRLKALLGVSLEDLRALVEAEDTRAALREEFHATAQDAPRRREILLDLGALLDRQLELVRARRGELDALEADLAERRAKVADRLAAGA